MRAGDTLPIQQRPASVRSADELRAGANKEGGRGRGRAVALRTITYGCCHPRARYGAGPFLLGEGEALVIDGTLPDCAFANVVLWNRYLQSFDYTRNTVSLNRHVDY